MTKDDHDDQTNAKAGSKTNGDDNEDHDPAPELHLSSRNFLLSNLPLEIQLELISEFGHQALSQSECWRFLATLHETLVYPDRHTRLSRVILKSYLCLSPGTVNTHHLNI